MLSDEATSASGLNPTGTSQPVTMPKVDESTSVATTLLSMGESSTRCKIAVLCVTFCIHRVYFCVCSDEAIASDVNGIQNTSPLIIPTSTPSFGKMVQEAPFFILDLHVDDVLLVCFACVQVL